MSTLWSAEARANLQAREAQLAQEAARRRRNIAADYSRGVDYNQDHRTGYCHCGYDEYVAPGLAWCDDHDYIGKGD